VADVGEEKTFVDGDVGGVLIGGGVGGALVGVTLPSHVCLATLFLVVVLLLHLILPFHVFIPVNITCIWTFSNIVTRLTTSVANPLEAGFVLIPLTLLEDLSETLNDKSHLLIVKLGGIN
jgi:multisubunit Na+/H+ antiporter MnhE subunit